MWLFVMTSVYILKDGIGGYNYGKLYSFMDQEPAQKTGAFYMIGKASPKRFEG